MTDLLSNHLAGTSLELSIDEYLHEVMLGGVSNVFDAGALWKRAGRRDRRPGQTLEEALKARPRSEEMEPEFVEIYYGHVRVHVPHQAFILDQTKGKGVGARGLVTRLTELHRQRFGGLLGEGGSTRMEVRPDRNLGRDEVRFEFGAAVFLPEPEARARQDVRLAIGEGAQVLMARLYPGQDIAMLCALPMACPEGHAHWPYGPGTAILVMGEGGYDSSCPAPVSIPAFHLGIERLDDVQGDRRYRITHPDHPDAMLSVSAPRVSRRAPSVTSPFRARPDALSDGELRDALSALSLSRHHSRPHPGGAGGGKDMPGDGPELGNLDGLEMFADDPEPRFGPARSTRQDQSSRSGQGDVLGAEALPSGRTPPGDNTGPRNEVLPDRNASVCDTHDLGGGTYLGGAVADPAMWIVGLPLHRLSMYARSGVRSLTIPLRRLNPDAPDQSLLVTARDEVFLSANGVLSPLDTNAIAALPAGLSWHRLPPVAQSSYLGWVELSAPVRVALPAAGWSRLGRDDSVDVAPNWIADPALLAWEGTPRGDVTPEQFNFSRHQLDLALGAVGLMVRMRGQAPAYLLGADGRLRDVLRTDGTEEAEVGAGERLLTGNYVIAATIDAVRSTA